MRGIEGFWLEALFVCKSYGSISLDEAGKMNAGKPVVVATVAYVEEICTELEKDGRFGKVYRVS